MGCRRKLHDCPKYSSQSGRLFVVSRPHYATDATNQTRQGKKVEDGEEWLTFPPEFPWGINPLAWFIACLAATTSRHARSDNACHGGREGGEAHVRAPRCCCGLWTLL